MTYWKKRKKESKATQSDTTQTSKTVGRDASPDTAGKDKKRNKKQEKGGRWMPRLREAKKDVISCDNLGVGANIH